ncbi:DUF3429 domain-containing protein [Croceibacterium sp. TMG7-5b_MA50]|uniref:DUF3429 domain-containing protein n=1 Tax=Croceibacterium sp. TMG7-5b_MA50 TaxID=3121290 RepID=UPI0032221FA0
MITPALPRPPVLLGLAGILPQAALLLVTLVLPLWRWAAVAAGCFYAAIILSFLGGMWWMLGLLTGRRDWGIYLLAVVPSLIGWAALLPGLPGWSGPAPSLTVLGFCLLASPLIDRALNRDATLPADWLRLRRAMSTGLGLTTLGLAFA